MSFRMNVDASSLEGNIGPLVAAFVDEIGDEVLDNARRLVPIDEGGTRDSLDKNVDGEGFERVNQIGSDESHIDPSGRKVGKRAIYLELGTSKMSAQPFLKPSLYQARRS
jgi:HK97 gp10 family phage protein